MSATTTFQNLTPMSWHLVQTSIDPPGLEPVQRALQASGIFPAFDAHGFVRDAFGVLVRDLEHEVALNLQAFLAAEGVSVEAIPTADWPGIPPGKRIRNASCRPDGFIPLDPLGRELVIPWDSIAAVACGLVQETEFGKRVTASVSLGRTPVPLNPTMNRIGDSPTWWESGDTFAYGDPLPTDRLVLTGEERNWRWNAEVILAGGLRFTWKSHLFEPTRESILEGQEIPDFFGFIRDLLHYLPHAALNRGAFAIKTDQPDAAPRYPTRNAFEEETCWILFHLRQSGIYR